MPSSEESSSTTSELLHPYGYSTVISNVKKQRPNAIWMDINAKKDGRGIQDWSNEPV